MLEPLDEQPVPVERAEAFGADDFVQAARARPGKDLFEQRRGRFLIVFTFKQVELRLSRVMIVVEAGVDQRGDASHVAPVAHGDEEIGVGVLVERMLLLVQHQLHVHAQRRHPLRMILVQAIRNIDETADVLACPEGQLVRRLA